MSGLQLQIFHCPTCENNFQAFSSNCPLCAEVLPLEGAIGPTGPDFHPDIMEIEPVKIMSGRGPPTERLARSGDRYINVETYTYYIGEGGEWVQTFKS